MLFNFKHKATGGLVGFALLLIVAGCKNPKPPVEKIEPVPAVSVVASNPPPVVQNTPPFVSHPRPAADAADNMASNILSWDAVAKEYAAQAGETNAVFVFHLKNVSPEPLTIYDTSTTCDCTIAHLPAKPWKLAPGAEGMIRATLDLQNRTTEAVTNYVIVFTSKGNRLLTVKGILPKP